MKQQQHLFLGAIFTLTSAVMVAYATMGGQYSVNIHFVPPLVTGTCRVAQFWTPANVTCALCFCMTGTLSRCIPQPGCIPNNSTTNATTTTPASPTAMSNIPPATSTETIAPAQNGSAAATTVAPPTNSSASLTNFIRRRRTPKIPHFGAPIYT